MVLDRRSVLMMAGSGLVVACSGGAVANRHDAAAKGRDDKLPSPPPRNAAGFAPIWAAFKGSYVQPDGRVVDTGNNGISHSEGQGYGMIMAARAGDRAAFDSIFAWSEKTLARPNDGLFSWRYDPRAAVPVGDPNNATDGDMLIAWGLMLGAARWRERHLSERAATIRAALHDTMVRPIAGESYLLPGGTGFVREGSTTLNPSYYVWPALQLFRAADGGARWDAVLRGGQTLLARARFGPNALPTDWVDVAADGSMAPAVGRPARFGFDAIRIPLYLALADRRGGAEPIARFWKRYGQQPIPAWIDVRSGETAPYPLSSGGMAVVRRLLGQPLPAPTPQADYYAAVLQALAMM
jgi:endoglucanase